MSKDMIMTWFPRAAWEPSTGRATSCSVTLARRERHSHAPRGNENLLKTRNTSWADLAIKFTNSKRLTF